MQPSSAVPQVVVREGCPLLVWPDGPVDRELVMFTHGGGLDHREWNDTLPVVSPEYRVLTWDVRGHGRSRPTGSQFTLARAADDLLAVLDAVGVQHAVMVGHSMGGNIAQEVIFRAPTRVQAAVLLGRTSNTQKLSFWEKQLARLVGPLVRLYPYELLRRQTADLYSDRPAVGNYLYKAFGQMSPADFKAIVPQLLKDIHDEPGYHIPVPFLLLHGEHDRSGNIRKLAPTWARSEPNAEYAVVPNAGHIANMDNPPVFNELLMGFLHSHSTADPELVQ